MIKTRAQLKEDFSNGNMPTGAHFAALIDSLVHHDELRSDVFKDSGQNKASRVSSSCAANGSTPFQVRLDEQNNLLVCKEDAVLAVLRAEQQQWVLPASNERPTPLVVEGWQRSAARIGGYDPAASGATALNAADDLTTSQVEADGKWHPILPNLNGCYAFEIVAHACTTRTSRRQAMLHAIVLTSFNGSQQAISQTRICKGWSWRCDLRLKWRKNRSSWWRRPTGYDLCIKTGCNYGVDEAGQKALIRYHITRLW